MTNCPIPSDHVDEPNPGTPDALIPHVRLQGRKAAREGLSSEDCPYPGGLSIGGFSNQRGAWFLGWYDVRLAKFYI